MGKQGFESGNKHVNVKKAKARQMAKLKQEVGVASGLRPKVERKRKALGLAPQEGPQLEMLMAKWCPEIFFGGARGGGKSIALLLDYLQDCGKGYGNGWRGVIFRRTYPQLKQLIEDSYRIYGKVPGATYFKKEREWIFPGGEKLEFRFLESYADVSNYQGHAYQWMGFDELPNWPDLDAYDAMKASLRPTSHAVPCRTRSSGNPGGIGHGIVKQRFIDPYEDGVKGWKVIPDDGKGERMFIPSNVWDNKILLRNDPNYIKRLEQSGPDHLVKAWLYGEWDLVLGAFFDCWSENNVVETGAVPRHWFRFRSFDWGGHAPFCVLWWAVSDGVTPINGREGNYILPAGAKVCYREWYGCDEKDFKKGLSLDNEEIARGILKRTEPDEEIAFTVTDNLPFQRRGGPTIAEVFAKEGVRLMQGDTDRVSGCAAMYLAIKGGEARIPMMYFMQHCRHCIRQIPILQKDEKMVEVYEQTNDDHAGDCCFAGDTLVQTDKGLIRIDKMPRQGFVLAGDGIFREYHSCRIIDKNTKVIKLKFNDGSEVICTPDHKFLTETGWVEARLLTDATKLKAINSSIGVVSLEPAGFADVYCLTQPETSSFVLANGSIVHNCKLAAKVREHYNQIPVSLPSEAERLHNSIIQQPTWNQIMKSHFTKLNRSRNPYGL